MDRNATPTCSDKVRGSGVDPLTEVDAVRRFARSAVLAPDQRSLTGVVRPVDDPEAVIDVLVARVSGFGPLQRYLDDPTVEEIWINQPQRVFVARDGRHELTTTILTTIQVRDLIERMLKASGRRLDVSSPFVDAMLPSGHRLHVVLDGITRGFSAVNDRNFVMLFLKCDETREVCQQSASGPQKSAFCHGLEREIRPLLVEQTLLDLIAFISNPDPHWPRSTLSRAPGDRV